MKLLLSSFGIGSTPWAHASYFYKLPAISMGSFGPYFAPDYPVFLLFDEFVVDAQTLDKLRDDRHYAYCKEVLSLLNALKAAGRLTVRDFDSDIAPYEDAIQKAVSYDLRNMESWTDAFQLSFDRWADFCAKGAAILRKKQRDQGLSDSERSLLLEHFEHPGWGMCAIRDIRYTGIYPNIPEMLRKWRRGIDRRGRESVRDTVRRYFECINRTLFLCDLFEAALHDWADFQPLYAFKMDTALRRSSAKDREQKEVRRLFDLLFQGFKPKNADSFVRILEDSRIEGLRKIVDDAVNGDLDLDVEFATATLREVLGIEGKLARYRKLTGWLAMPLGLIPWAGTVAQKIGEESVEKIMGKRVRRPMGWFYLISDLADSESGGKTATNVHNR